LNRLLQDSNDYEVIDIREPYEYKAANTGARNIPMADVVHQIDELPKHKNLVFMCKSGKRAEALVNLLNKDYSLPNVFVLEGGILAWKENVDINLAID